VPPRITRSDVEHVAKLARLALTEDEMEQFTGQLADILEHAAKVSALDTADVPPTAHPLPLVNVLRPDEPRPGIDPESALAMAPAAEAGRFRVPRILDAP
jgi:aspartyl-tRNA(Asn)/glutamyl-tRNA(Gln) amidotransferase subunit C